MEWQYLKKVSLAVAGKDIRARERCDLLLQAAGREVIELQCPSSCGRTSVERSPARKSVSLLRKQVTSTS